MVNELRILPALVDATDRFMKGDAKIDPFAPDGLGAVRSRPEREASCKRPAPHRQSSARRAFSDDAHPRWSDGTDRSDLETALDVLLG